MRQLVVWAPQIGITLGPRNWASKVKETQRLYYFAGGQDDVSAALSSSEILCSVLSLRYIHFPQLHWVIISVCVASMYHMRFFYYGITIINNRSIQLLHFMKRIVNNEIIWLLRYSRILRNDIRGIEQEWNSSSWASSRMENCSIQLADQQ